MALKTIFLDRDGVINEEINYLHKIKDFKFIDGVFEVCKFFEKLGYRIIIITNQSGIARGFYSENDYQNLNNWMLKKFELNGVKILDTFHCPHHPSSNCYCRKPKPGMFLEVAKIHDIDYSRSWMVGDKETDIQAANAAGIFNTILVRSGHKIDEFNSKSTHIIDSIKESKNVIKK
tara:strand:- start:707 stop:1234 length:528 start_codon:yes stop_codon:yes gene_type:complete